MSRPAEDLDACYELCRRLTKRHGSTYHFAARFFPPEIRRSVFGLYGFVRVPDELVDNPAHGEAEERAQRRNLLAWREQFVRAMDGERADHPVMRAFADTARRHAIPRELPLAFLDAMLMDVSVCRYETFSELCRYTHGSAAVIGLMICAILGVDDPATLPYAADLGLAMQLTNILRDVGEDYRERCRIYLPLEDLRRFGYQPEELAAGIINAPFRELMRFEIARTRAIYRRAEPGIAALPPFARYPVRLAGRLYAAILERIERNGYDVFTRRATTSKAYKLGTAATIWAAGRLHSPCPLVPHSPPRER
ncbi:MAG TPA: phytoene/squalene synthase family protein [Dehalococcoidia bacterium]|jgi:phytoene synthase